jgi:hypothetical protein
MNPPFRTEQGAYRDRRERGAECGGRVGAVRRAAIDADGEVVWFWRAQARRQVVGLLQRLCDSDGGKTAKFTGKSTL